MKIKFPPAFCSCSKASSFSSSSQKSTSEIDDERETKLVVENGWPARSDRLFNRVSDDPFVPFLFLGFFFVFKWETMKDSQHDTSNETSRCGRYRICRREKKTKMRFGGNQIIDCSWVAGGTGRKKKSGWHRDNKSWWARKLCGRGKRETCNWDQSTKQYTDWPTAGDTINRSTRTRE